MNTAGVRKFAATVNSTFKQFRKKLEISKKAQEHIKKALDGFDDEGEHDPEFHKNMKLAKKYSNMIKESVDLTHGYREGTNVKIKEGENAGKKGYIVYSAGNGTHHTVHDRKGRSLGFHPTSNLLNTDPVLKEDSTPNVGSMVVAIRGQANGRVQSIAPDQHGEDKASVKTDDGRIITTPVSNLKVESMELLNTVRRILAESYLLLEYNEEKTWSNYGDKIKERLGNEGVSEDHDKVFHSAVRSGDPTKNKEYGRWIAHKYSTGGINRLEDIGARVKPLLTKFHEFKKKGLLPKHGVEADINKYKNIGDLSSAVAKLPSEAVTETGEEKARKAEARTGATRHLAGENEHWEHFVLSGDNGATHDESRYLAHHHGGGTGGDTKHPAHCEWCTAQNGEQSKDMFAHYTNKEKNPEDNTLHIMIPKNPTHPGERYQIHHGSDQQMTEKDDQADLHSVFKDRPWPDSYQRVLEGHLNRILGE